MKKCVLMILVLLVTALFSQTAKTTVFSDDFERTVITDKWIFNPATAYWGRDTTLKYAGLASLSDSPGTNYSDNTELLTAGGSFAEISSGFDFTLAADAACKFWIKYEIEQSFDYLHFQVCKDSVSWLTLKTWSSEVLGDSWAFENINLSLFAGESNVKIRFLLATDPGYNAAGSNIDNVEITTSTFDPVPPYIYYTKEKDYNTPQADGFEITTQITDFTGINYARVYYKVNGGTEVYVNPASITGTSTDAVYYWKLPVQTPGSLIEFRIEVQDSNGATGSKGPFYYREGLHQKYDSGEVSYYTEVVTTTAQYDIKSVANKFTSFHDDIVGAIIRGYDDASQPEDNANILVNVWAYNNGLPGAALITPVSFTNPATLSETNAWGYVDLSSYTALDEMVGDYFIGFECGTTPNTTVTRSCQTAPAVEGTLDFERSYTQIYQTAGGTLTWEQSIGTNYHIRCVTTDKQIIPGIIDPSPNEFNYYMDSGTTSSLTLNVYNIGGYQLDYTASIDYDGYASSAAVHENNFDDSLGWTATGDRLWTRSTTVPTVNGSVGYAKVLSATTAGNITSHSYLTSPIINMSNYGSNSYISFQHVSLAGAAGGNTQSLEVSVDGINWLQIWTHIGAIGAMGAPDSRAVNIPAAYVSATTRFRFHATLRERTGSWNLDNIVITGCIPYSWLNLDGGATTSGTVAVSSSDPITVRFNATGLGGTYTANIRLNSQYSNESVPVQLTVFNLTLPYAPTLISPTNGQNLYDLTPYFDWTDATYATAYNIMIDNNSDYSSPEVNTEVSASNYQQATNLATGIYYWKVRSKNVMGYSTFTGSWTVNILFGIPVPIVIPPNTIDWADVEGATSYNIFSSQDPYGTFTFLSNVTVSQYTYSTADQRMFFYIAAVNGSKEHPKTIIVPEKKEK